MPVTLSPVSETHLFTIQTLKQPISKRLFDILFSFSALIILSPLFACIAIMIRLSSKGEIIYIQPRMGKGGKIFNCYKFRTMHHNAEKRLLSLLTKHPHLKREWEEKQKLKNDPRIFPIGKWLRRTSLDELPQFWNVLKGDLSLVGPRPYILSQKKELGAQAFKILSVTPGLTGLWQTSGRSRTTFQQRVHFDIQYIEKKYSFWYDFYIILKTIPLIFYLKNAY